MGLSHYARYMGLIIKDTILNLDSLKPRTQSRACTGREAEALAAGVLRKTLQHLSAHPREKSSNRLRALRTCSNVKQDLKGPGHVAERIPTQVAEAAKFELHG